MYLALSLDGYKFISLFKLNKYKTTIEVFFMASYW